MVIPLIVDGQGLGTTDKSHPIRKLGTVDAETYAAVEGSVRAGLAL